MALVCILQQCAELGQAVLRSTLCQYLLSALADEEVFCEIIAAIEFARVWDWYNLYLTKIKRHWNWAEFVNFYELA